MAALNFPSPAAGGDIYQGTNGVTYIYISDGAGGGYWSGASSANNEAPNIEIGNDPPPFPKEGDLWWDSTVTSGRLYVYYEDGDSNQWVEASPAAGEDSIDNLWKKVGNDLSPIEDTDNVIIGGGDISLNADGSSTFKGRLNVAPNGLNLDSDYVSLYESGAVGVRRNSGSDSDYLWIGISGTTDTSRINKDGSASFGGDVLIPDSGYRSTKGIKLFRTGIVQAVGENLTNVFMGFDVNDGPSGIATSYILANGSAGFTGDVKIGGTIPSAPNITLQENGRIKTTNELYVSSTAGSPGVSIYNNSGTSSDKNALAVSDVGGGTPKTIELRYDGSAEFAGDLRVSGATEPLGNKANSSGIYAWTGGAITVVQSSITSGSTYLRCRKMVSDGVEQTKLKVSTEGVLLLGFDLENTAPEISLNGSNGSAQFGGTADTGEVGVQIYGTGEIDVTNATSGAQLWKGRQSGSSTVTSSISTTGAAMFAGTVESQQSVVAVDLFKGGYGSTSGMFVVRGNGTIVGHDNGNATTGNYTYKIDSNGWAKFGSDAISLNADGSAEFAGAITADNVTFNLEADDDTKYTSTTDVDGNETIVYNGDVLDVKALLLTLRTAASRIETLETAKASLEARLTALEGAN